MLLFLDVSGGELLVILLFILLFFGSKGIPGIARTMGRTMRQIRDASAEVQREIQRGADDVQRGFQEQRKVFEPPTSRSSTPIAAPVSSTAPAHEDEVEPPPGPPGTQPQRPEF